MIIPKSALVTVVFGGPNSAIQTVAEAPEAELGLRRRGAWKNGETLGRFRLGCSLFNGRVSAALR
ncbi:MAG: hypothetical protein Q8N47_16100, partial [Bryobacterales bacterium]|nr:hypothetical protein [Bryobacterales bacterium]